jgi:hypothetical protein
VEEKKNQVVLLGKRAIQNLIQEKSAHTAAQAQNAVMNEVVRADKRKDALTNPLPD